MVECLDKARIYLDFGWHPGADRGPREAALRGCIVFINDCRNASHPIDVPLPADYRLNWIDRQDLLDRVSRTIENAAHHLTLQSDYRIWVQGARDRFRSEVGTLIAAGWQNMLRWSCRSISIEGIDQWHREVTAQYLHQLRNLNELAAGHTPAPDQLALLLGDNTRMKVLLAPRLVRFALSINAWLRRRLR
jgi:hypothetical protein